MVHLLRYISDNKTLGLKYYADMKDAPLSDLLRKANFNTKNQLMDFANFSWKYFSDTSRSTGAYIIFYQGGTIDNDTNVPVPVSQSSAESECNVACTSGMYFAQFGMLINELLNKDTDIVS